MTTISFSYKLFDTKGILRHFPLLQLQVIAGILENSKDGNQVATAIEAGLFM